MTRLWHISDQYTNTNLFFRDEDVVSALETYLPNARMACDICLQDDGAVLVDGVAVAIAVRAARGPAGYPVLHREGEQLSVIGYAMDEFNAARVVNMYRLRHCLASLTSPMVSARMMEFRQSEALHAPVLPCSLSPLTAPAHQGAWVSAE